MNGQSDRIIAKLRDKAYRDAYVESHIEIGIPHQIRAMREQEERKWSQAELGRRCGKPANVISRLEDPEYGSYTIHTLLEIASACDVALLVKFVPFGRFLEEFEDVSPQALEVPSFPNDPYVSGVYQAQQVSTYIVQPEALANGLFVPNAGQYPEISGMTLPSTPNVIYVTNVIEPKGAMYAEKQGINIPFIRNLYPRAYHEPYLGTSDRECEQRISADRGEGNISAAHTI